MGIGEETGRRSWDERGKDAMGVVAGATSSFATWDNGDFAVGGAIFCDGGYRFR